MTTDCRNELALLGRRGTLSSTQRIALEQHLHECPSCRMTQQFSEAFETVDCISACDTEHIDAMQLAASRWIEQPRSLTHIADRKRRVRAALLVAALSITATAAATTFVLRDHFFGKTVPAEAPGAVGSIPERTNEPLVVPDSVPTSTPFAVGGEAHPAPSESPVSRVSPDAAPRVGSVARSVPDEAPGQLLQRATVARRSGELVEAGRLYQRLQQRFPTSGESQLSRVVYGGMLLEQGQPERALQQYERYLTSQASHNLSAEALYGKGRALAQLGRTAEERTTWQLLVEQYPKSPYVAHANKRLGSSK